MLPFPRGHQNIQDVCMARGASSASSALGTESMQDAVVQTFFLAGAGGRNRAERKLTSCGLSHSSPVAQARGSPSSACLEFSPWLPVPLGAGNSGKSALGWGAQHLNVPYTTSPQEKTEFLRPILKFPPTCP